MISAILKIRHGEVQRGPGRLVVSLGQILTIAHSKDFLILVHPLFIELLFCRALPWTQISVLLEFLNLELSVRIALVWNLCHLRIHISLK